MNFKVDENLPAEAASIFREQGFGAETVWDESLSGADDEAIATRVGRAPKLLMHFEGASDRAVGRFVFETSGEESALEYYFSTLEERFPLSRCAPAGTSGGPSR